MRHLLACAFLFLIAFPVHAMDGATYRDDGAIEELQEGDSRECYSYDEAGRFVAVKKYKGEELQSITWYSYDLATGNLSLVQETGKVTYFQNDGFSIGDDDSFEQYEKVGDSYYLRTHLVDGIDRKKESTVTVDEKGNLVHTSNNDGVEVVETYDGSGNLVSHVSKQGDAYGERTYHEYDEKGSLVKQTTHYPDGKSLIQSYENGVLSGLVEMEGDVVVKETRLLPSKVETIYDKGRPYARIVYDERGGVKEVSYL